MVWGRPYQNGSNGGWIDYGNGKGRGGSDAGGWRTAGRPRQTRGDRGSRGAKDTRAKELKPAFMKTWTEEDTKQVLALLHRTAGAAKQQDDKDVKWECQCGYGNFAFRQQCNSCGSPKCGAGLAAVATEGGSMEVDGGSSKTATPEQRLKVLELQLKHHRTFSLKAESPHALWYEAQLLGEIEGVKAEIRQARPLPVRLQATVKAREAAFTANRVAKEAIEKSRLIYESKVKAGEVTEAALVAADLEVAEVERQLGRPQLEAGATAAVAVCIGTLQKLGMTSADSDAFVEALKAAFGVGPAVVAPTLAPSPFAVKNEAGLVGAGVSQAAQGLASGSGGTAPFSQGGAFPSQGPSAFGEASGMTVEQRQEDELHAARALEAQRLEWEQSRAVALAAVKQRLEVQRLKHGAALKRLEVAKMAAGTAKGGAKETEAAAEAAALEKEVRDDQFGLDAMESSRQELESDAFVKAASSKTTRPGPF